MLCIELHQCLLKGLSRVPSQRKRIRLFCIFDGSEMLFTATRTLLGTKTVLAATVSTENEQYVKKTLFDGSNLLFIIVLAMIIQPCFVD
ncbi:hypothetical protein FORC22_4788 (plasmid) [Vibrio parahaemolyticus]|nr:hypothetical protein FORC22_4788 [Vibrio parahaemolyticus]